MIGGGWEPTPGQELLLAAALGPESRTASTWSAWRAATGGCDLNTLEAGTARLLPLLMPRLGYLPSDDPALPLIRGYYRRTYYHSQLLRHRAAAAIAALTAAGIRTLVSKGGLLGTSYYEHPGLRPMNDFDVLVPSSDAPEAMRVLAGVGWQSTMPGPEHLPLAYHAVCFCSPDGLDFDLHWHLLPEACFADADEPAWRAAEPLAINGVATLGLAPTDLLVVVCAHAAHWQPQSPVRWIADALKIMRHPSTRVDWDRVVMLAERWHVVLHLHDTLGYLSQRWLAPVPAAVLRSLSRSRVSDIDRAAYTLLGSMPNRVAYLRRPWVRYRLRTRDCGALGALPQFLRYLQITLGRDSVAGLPSEMLRRYRRWRKDRAHALR
jgi:hypothetical protein